MTDKRAAGYVWGVLAGGILLLGCELGAVAQLPGPVPQRQPILGGEVIETDANVFALRIAHSQEEQGTRCTATLIGRRSLLTAAHCLEAATVIWATNANNWNSADSANSWKAVTWTMHPQWKGGNSWLEIDIGLVLLDTPLYDSSVRVLPKLWTHAGGYNPKAGQQLRAIGYGFNNHPGADAQKIGIKKAVNLFVFLLDANLLWTNAYYPPAATGTQGICNGDSGGPLFARFADGTERIVGVLAFMHPLTKLQSCGLVAYYQRLDHPEVRDFINDWLKKNNELPPCAQDGLCMTPCPTADLDCAHCGQDNVCAAGCPTADLDCMHCSKDKVCAASIRCTPTDPDCAHCGQDNVCAAGIRCTPMDPDCAHCGQDNICVAGCPTTDLDCTPLGQPCSDAKQCAGQLCITDAQHNKAYCSQPCSDTAPCGEGYVCQTGGNTGGSCIFIQLPEISRGAPCTPDKAWCLEDRVCTGSTRDAARCQLPCGTDDACPAGSRCVAGFNAQHYCHIPPMPLAKASLTLPGGCSQGTGGTSLLGLGALVHAFRRRRQRLLKGAINASSRRVCGGANAKRETCGRNTRWK